MFFTPWPTFCRQTANASSKANSPQCKHRHTHKRTHSGFSLLRNMRAGSDSQAGKAVVDSNLDLAGLGYFYFPESHGEEGRRRSGGRCVCMWRERESKRERGWRVWGGKILVRQRPVTRGCTYTHTHQLTHTHKHPWKKPKVPPRKETHHSPSHQPEEEEDGGMRGQEGEQRRRG